MYFTIPAGPPSSPPSSPPLSPDAVDALIQLRRRATVLADLSASFTQEAKAAIAAYADALCEGSDAAWSRFVGAAATLVVHAESVDEIVHLTDDERQALEFFKQIVRENDDLLDVPAIVTA